MLILGLNYEIFYTVCYVLLKLKQKMEYTIKTTLKYPEVSPRVLI
jgi:hypothetical protein